MDKIQGLVIVLLLAVIIIFAMKNGRGESFGNIQQRMEFSTTSVSGMLESAPRFALYNEGNTNFIEIDVVMVEDGAPTKTFYTFEDSQVSAKSLAPPIMTAPVSGTGTVSKSTISPPLMPMTVEIEFPGMAISTSASPLPKTAVVTISSDDFPPIILRGTRISSPGSIGSIGGSVPSSGPGSTASAPEESPGIPASPPANIEDPAPSPDSPEQTSGVAEDPAPAPAPAPAPDSSPISPPKTIKVRRIIKRKKSFFESICPII